MLDKRIVGKNIAKFRAKKGISQKELARLLNISAQSISKWESGISMPTVDMLYGVSSILGVSADSILSEKEIENRDICYMDTGLDVNRLYNIKNQLNEMITSSEELVYAHYIDPAIFKADIKKYKEPVIGMITNVPGSKARLARERGFDAEICADVTARAINHLLRMGLTPKMLQATIVCGTKDDAHLLAMGESFKKTCESNEVMFAGLEVACQPINYRANEYELSVGAVGIGDRNQLFTRDDVKERDVVIALMSDGMDAASYPFVRIMLDRKPEMAYEKIDNEHYFIDEVLKPNVAFTFAIRELQEEGLIHQIIRSENNVLNPGPYSQTIPDGLGVCMDFSKLPLKPLYKYMLQQDMVGKNFFPYRFSMGIGMLVVVSEADEKKALKIISKYHDCHSIGKVEKCGDDGKKVWIKGKIQ